MKPVAPQALKLLIAMLEMPSGGLVEDALGKDQRDAFQLLRQYKFLNEGPEAVAVMCPACGDHDVEPRMVGRELTGLCPKCGRVAIYNESLKVWKVDYARLLLQLRVALGIASRQDSDGLVENIMWKVGDYKVGRRNYRIVFARRLADYENDQEFQRALDDHIEKHNAVVIGTTPRSLFRVSDPVLSYVELFDLVHLRSGKLELDQQHWEWCLKPSHLRQHRAVSGLSEDYRVAVIDGKEYTFSKMQAEVLEYIHSAGGGRREKCLIMAHSSSKQDSPVDLFQHDADQMRAFKHFVEWDVEGFYWWLR